MPVPLNAPTHQTICTAQRQWATQGVVERLAVIERVRRALVADADRFIAALEPRSGRVPGESVSMEILPLADAARFVVRAAPALLATRHLGRRLRPGWLFGASAEIRREPIGLVLILAPGNYPLFLPGVQILQALAAGNAVLVKPAPGGRAVMLAFAELLRHAGLPDDLCVVLDDTVEAGRLALADGIDKLVLTGSATTGRIVMNELAKTATPSVMELSGTDAVFVLPGADPDLTARALAFGLRMNGGETCISPRRVFVIGGNGALEAAFAQLLDGFALVRPADAARERMLGAIEDAQRAGARLLGPVREGTDGLIAPVALGDVPPDARAMREDIFAPILSFCRVPDVASALAAAAESPYALAASVFGPQDAARDLAGKIDAGSVTINDMIVTTADPRLPFAARRGSGFGATRGAEGLLEFTQLKAITIRSGSFRPHYDPPGAAQQRLARAFLDFSHATGLGAKLRGFGGLLAALRAYRPGGD